MSTPPSLLQQFVMPRPVWRTYLLGCVPLFLVYAVAVETDGVLTRGLNLISALQGAARMVLPALVLLYPVWAYTGWMERRGFGATRSIANHLGMAVLYTVAWHALLYALTWWLQSQASAERARANWFLWQGMWGMMMYWAAAGGFTAYRAIERAKREAEASAQAHALLARAELAALRSRLEPHFLFNTLHSILALVRKDAVRAEAALLKFSELLRHVLDTERRDDDAVTLADELAFTRDYLDLEALRLGPRLNVRWQIDEALLGCRVPALSLQPLVENSIKHAFNPRATPGQLTIEVQACGTGQVRVRVADDGPGLVGTAEVKAATAGTGLGLSTVSRRLEMALGPGSALKTEANTPRGFAVSFVLPLSELGD